MSRIRSTRPGPTIDELAPLYDGSRREILGVMIGKARNPDALTEIVEIDPEVEGVVP